MSAPPTRSQRPHTRSPLATPQEPVAEPASARSRQFADARGLTWHVRRFVPTTAPALLSNAHALGWLTFECADGDRRRLVPAPVDWEGLPDDALARALASARPVARADAMRRSLTNERWDEADD